MIDPVGELARLFGSMRIVDLAPKLERGMPRFPSHPHFVLDKTVTHGRNGYYCQSLQMAEHTGCHCDAPPHNHPSMMDSTIDKLPIDSLIGPAVVYDFASLDLQPGQLIDVSDIEELERKMGVQVGRGDIALVNFGWLKRHWRTDDRSQWYANNSPGMSEGVAALFKERGVKAVGADTVACEVPLVDGHYGNSPGHERHWLPNGILILECVANLEQVPGKCFFVALPLPIDEGSGSPLRPIALI